MRITEGMVYRQVLGDIQGPRGRLLALEQQLSSGRRINRPSDDPAGTQSALDLTHAIAQNAQYKDAADSGADRLNAADKALDDVASLAGRVRQLILQGANTALPPEARSAILTELQSLREQLVELANSRMGDTFLFGGTRDSQAPWSVDASGNLVYAGDTNPVLREIGPGVRVAVGVDVSSEILGLYQAIAQAETDLQNADVAALGGPDLQAVSDAQSAVIDKRAQVGALSSRMQVASDRLAALGVTLEALRSGVTDIDVAKAALDFGQQETALQMALQVGAQLLQPTLVDFLR
ncbi:MAG: flagellar hook-associated protein FlgL [Clostridia bacterium]|nr:flagellar hook-associated protein FlgL [Clostridia bacterium]